MQIRSNLDLFNCYGQFDKVVNITFSNDSGCFKRYGGNVTGIFRFSKGEREKYIKQLKSDSFDDRDNKIKFRVLITKDLTPKLIDDLYHEGFNINCISHIFTSNLFDKENKFEQEGSRELPEPIKVNFKGGFDGHKLEYSLYRMRIKNGDPLLEFEYDRLSAILLAFQPQNISKEFYNEHIIDNNTKGVKRNILIQKQLIDPDIDDDENMSIDEETNSAFKSHTNDIQSTIEKELDSSGLSKKEYHDPNNLFWLWDFLMKTGVWYSPKILLYSNPLVYLDFKGFIHITLRHVKVLQLGKNVKDKTTFKYELKDIETIFEYIINEISEDISNHFKLKGNVQFRKKHIYFEGDYYTVSIDRNGRIETIHRQ